MANIWHFLTRTNLEAEDFAPRGTAAFTDAELVAANEAAAAAWWRLGATMLDISEARIGRYFATHHPEVTSIDFTLQPDSDGTFSVNQLTISHTDNPASKDASVPLDEAINQVLTDLLVDTARVYLHANISDGWRTITIDKAALQWTGK